jgi:catechol 2,3-dioxygenase-like lactoylglutathione lyase family enzyme
LAVLGVNHIAFRTPDPARLRQFYAELLHAEEVDGAFLVRDPDGRRVELTFDDLGVYWRE